ncbi:MAG: DUF934 domain-containing protein [Deltaproteobacteria bacterium]|nr:MAG: DUF934 domain-containing protein [Deltaproteobacteria bacterium]
MRKIIRNREIVESPWARVGQDGELPAGPVMVPFKRWLAEQDKLAARGDITVYLEGDDDARALAPHLENLEFVAIDFPKFADGRGYSHARILRDDLGYKGELRAVGDILRDQIFYLARCGFNAFEVREDKDLEEALEGLLDFSVTYQAAADEKRPIYRR